MQETPENVPEGETPQTIHLCAYDDLVDATKPGDRVEIIGIYKAMGVRVDSGKRTLKNVYRTYIDVINYVKTDRRRFNVDTSDPKQAEAMDVDENANELDLLKDEHQGIFTKEQIDKFHQFSRE